MKKQNRVTIVVVLVCSLLVLGGGLFAQGGKDQAKGDKIIIETFSDLFPEY